MADELQFRAIFSKLPTYFMMIKRKIGPSKVLNSSSAARPKEGVYLAIVEVKEKKYVPIGVKLRQWISDFIFTAEIRTSELPRLEENSNISSIQLNQRLQQI
jgi:hypothetical protein